MLYKHFKTEETANQTESHQIKSCFWWEGNRSTGGKNLSEQRKKNKKLNPCMALRAESNPGHFGGRRVFSPLHKLSVLKKKVVVNTTWWKKKRSKFNLSNRILLFPLICYLLVDSQVLFNVITFQYDIKNRRLFLKRSLIDGLELHHLFIGAIINIHSRQVMQYLLQWGIISILRMVLFSKETCLLFFLIVLSSEYFQHSVVMLSGKPGG